MAVPDCSPRASVVVSVRNPQRLMLADGTLFLPGCCAVPWGRVSAPAGVAPEALQNLAVCEVLVSAGVGNVSASLDGAMHTCLAYICIWCISRRCSRASSPRSWAQSWRSRGALHLVHTPLRRHFAGQRGEASTTPIERVANCGFLVELLLGGSNGCPCPV
jgi:hypothetical protein